MKAGAVASGGESAHVADGELGDADVGGLETGEDDGGGDFGRVHHVGVADEFFGSPSAQAELGFDAAGADGADLDVMFAEFGVEGLGEAYLREFCGAVNGFSGSALQAGDGGDEEDGAGVLGDHMRGGVA